MSVAKKDTVKKFLYTKMGAYFKELRLSKDITQLEIATKMKVTPQYICNYENGAAGMGADLIRGFIKHYKLDSAKVVKDLHGMYKDYLDLEITKKLKSKAS